LKKPSGEEFFGGEHSGEKNSDPVPNFPEKESMTFARGTFALKTFAICLPSKCHPQKCISGQMSSGKMSFECSENVILL
jgi:hypothetical protein